MATANPALSEAAYDRAGYAESTANVMTLQGSILKTWVLVVLLLVTAAFTWLQAEQAMAAAGEGAAFPRQIGFLLGLGCIGGFITALITIFAPRISPVTAPLYAALEGLVLGGFSAFFETLYPGIVLQAVSLTIGTLVLLLMLYTGRVIQATQKFRIGVIAATGAICLVYLADLLLSFFGHRVPFIHETGWIGIGISLFVVVIAALNLILDFDFIEQGVKRRAPKFMEWYGGFSLMVTLIWLYIEVLSLLAKLRQRD
jgi:uncharacterized YccA/Bax inhibitor family protein